MVANIDRAQLVALIDEGAQLVDVLPESEYEAQHIPGAINIPLKQLTVETVATLRRDKPVVVY
jgi:rhodanese-related sulfurtransferase